MLLAFKKYFGIERDTQYPHRNGRFTPTAKDAKSRVIADVRGVRTTKAINQGALLLTMTGERLSAAAHVQRYLRTDRLGPSEFHFGIEHGNEKLYIDFCYVMDEQALIDEDLNLNNCNCEMVVLNTNIFPNFVKVEIRATQAIPANTLLTVHVPMQPNMDRATHQNAWYYGQYFYRTIHDYVNLIIMVCIQKMQHHNKLLMQIRIGIT